LSKFLFLFIFLFKIFNFALEKDLDGKPAYIFTGTYGTRLIMNEHNSSKRPVRLAAHYWMAFCYTDSGTTYSWAYIQENDPSEKYSSGKS